MTRAMAMALAVRVSSPTGKGRRCTGKSAGR